MMEMRGRLIALSAIGVLLGLVAGAFTYYLMRSYIPRNISLEELGKRLEGNEEEIELLPEPFPGWKDRERKRGLAVVIDNAREARPQSGLELADVVIEVPVEGGLTRFLAIMPYEGIDLVGPIRSARPYLVELAEEYQAVLVHAGGSEEALQLIKEKKLDHLDEIKGGPLVEVAFWRVSDRAKPHNLFASSDSLRRAGLNYYDMVTPPPLRSGVSFQEEISGTPVNEVTIFYPNRDTLARFEYNQERRVFERYTAERPHLTASGEQLTAANLIIQFVPFRYLDGEGRLHLMMHGDGKALIMRDGKMLSGQWHKMPGGFTSFTDENGKEIPLLEGPTWVQIVCKGTRVDY
jgi:hypothetical protein